MDKWNAGLVYLYYMLLEAFTLNSSKESNQLLVKIIEKSE